MAGKKKKKIKKKPVKGGKTGKIFVGVAGEGNSICAVKIRKTKTGAELLEAKQFTLKNNLDSVEIAGDIFEDFENIEEEEESSVDISESDEELNLLGISTEDEESKDDSGVFIEILKMASERGSKMAISLAEPQVFYNVFDSDWELKGKKLNKKVVEELATMKEEYVSLKNDSYQLLNITGDRLMAVVREPELAVIHQMENVKSYTGNRLPFISFIESSETSLINLVLQSYELPEKANSLILHVGPETSHFIFLQGTKLHHISPSMATGYTSENVSETLSSRLLFELDSLDLQSVDNVFLSGYAAKTKIQSFLEDTFQGETAIQVLTVNKLDKGSFEEDLPPEEDEIDPFAVPDDVPPSSDMMPEYEMDDTSLPGEVIGETPDTESPISSETGLSIEDELAMELGGGISAGSSIVDRDDELENQEKVTPKKIEDELEIELGNVPYTDLPPLSDMDEVVDQIQEDEQQAEEPQPEQEQENNGSDVENKVDDLISRVEEELANFPPVDDQPAYFQENEDDLDIPDEPSDSDLETDIEDESDKENDDDDDDDNSGNEEVIDYKPNNDRPFIIHDKSDEQNEGSEDDPHIDISDEQDSPELEEDTPDPDEIEITSEDDSPEEEFPEEDNGDDIQESPEAETDDGIDTEVDETDTVVEELDRDNQDSDNESEVLEDSDTDSKPVLEDDEETSPTDEGEGEGEGESEEPEDSYVDSEPEAEAEEETSPVDQEKDTETDESEDSSEETSNLVVPEEFSRADIELAIYAPALGAAMRAAGMTGTDYINLDITPTKIKEGQNRLMISTPGWIMIALIPFIGAYTYLEVEKQAKVVSDLKWQLIPLREQVSQYESVETSIVSAENTLANFERSFSVIDSLVIGTDTWSTFLNHVMKISDDLAGFWFTEISSMEEGRARLSGYSIYRNRIPRFIELLGNAQLKRVDVQEIRKKKVYRFEIEAVVTKTEEE